MRRRFPRALLPGMTVGLVAPASPVFEPDRRDAAVQLLEDMGFRVVRGESVDAVNYCFSGTDDVRAGDLMRMFTDDRVDAVVCLRGGYGCARLMDKLDYDAIARNPKLLVGFSDVTALHMALITRCGFVTCHGPMPGQIRPVGLREPRARAQWLDTLSGKGSREVVNPDGTPFLSAGTRSVTGRLLGGNLSVLTGLLGTPWEPAWDGALLLLEDVAERTDQLDGMLLRLQQRGVFDRIAGLMLGDFSRYDGVDNARNLPLENLFAERVPSSLPVLYGLHAGHGRDRMTLLLNARYRLDPRRASLTLTESPLR